MNLYHRFKNQTRKPGGILGSLMIKRMNRRHAVLSDWGLDCLRAFSPSEILELGCGGGRNAGELLKRYPEARVTAVDYSPLSVKKTEQYNRAMIRAGRCRVLEADVSRLPLPDGTYSLASAFETVYFWPGLPECFSEVRRVLKDGGLFLIVNESDGLDEDSQKYEEIIQGMKAWTAEEIEGALREAGFSRIQTLHHRENPWIAVLAGK